MSNVIRSGDWIATEYNNQSSPSTFCFIGGGPTYSISGTVTKSTGGGLAGAAVAMTGASAGSTTTDASGNYQFGGLAAGIYTVTATAAGYAMNAPQAVTVGPSAAANFTATAAVVSSVTAPTVTAGSTGTGTVTLSATVSAATAVSLSSNATGVATVPASVTVASGGTTANYTLTGVAAGTATITATLNTSSQTATATVNAAGGGGGAAEFVTGLTLGATWTNLTGWRGIRFLVGASPIQVTHVGRYKVSGNSQSHAMAIYRKQNSGQPALIASGVSVNLSAGTVGQFQYVALTTAVTLDANTEYYIVSRENSGQDAWAFSTATAFSSPVVGTIEGSIFTTNVNGNNGWTPDGGANFNSGPVNFKYTIPSTATYSISGTITKSTGGGLAGAALALSGAATGSTTTDGSGNYQFTGLAAGSYTATATAAGYAMSAPQTVTVGPNKTANFTATAALVSGVTAPAVTAGSTGTGTVTLSAVVSAATAVSLSSSATGVATAPASVTVAAGAATANYTLTGVAAGTATITATLNGSSQTATATVNPPGGGGGPTEFVTSLTLGATWTNLTGWVGIRFLVGASPIQVTHVGRYKVSGNSQSHAMAIYRRQSTGQPALIASGVSVNLSAGTVGQFQYVALTTPVTLSANTEYYIVSRENSGQDAWAYSTATAFSSPVAGTIEGSIFTTNVNGNNGWTPDGGVNFNEGPVNFRYTIP